MLPAAETFNFLLFCVRNPKPCLILDVLEPGQVEPIIAPAPTCARTFPAIKFLKKENSKPRLKKYPNVCFGSER